MRVCMCVCDAEEKAKRTSGYWAFVSLASALPNDDDAAVAAASRYLQFFFIIIPVGVCVDQTSASARFLLSVESFKFIHKQEIKRKRRKV